MSEETKNNYWKIYNRRMNKLASETDSKSINVNAARAVLIFIPIILIVSLFEYWFTKSKK